MNQLTATTAQRIQWMRYVRPAIDCALLLIGLLLWMYFDGISQSNDSAHRRFNRVLKVADRSSGNKLSTRTMVSLVQEFPAEAGLWEKLGWWLNNHPSSSGNCLIQAGGQSLIPGKFNVGTSTYLLQCISSVRSEKPNTRHDETHKPLMTLNILKAPKNIPEKISTKRNIVEQENPATEKKDYPVRGWINTPTGQKHFDPALKRWVP